ncbi:MAG: nucleotidyltransferase domain-containing protein [Anaerolineales bacterium]
MKAFSLSPEARFAIRSLLSKLLEKEERVAFSYLYGSFLDPLPFHDIDLGIYLDPPLERKSEWEFAVKLAFRLEDALRQAGYPAIPIDVNVLNHAPLSFRQEVFRGELLSNRQDDLRVSIVTRTMLEYLDILPLRRRAMKEALEWD